MAVCHPFAEKGCALSDFSENPGSVVNRREVPDIGSFEKALIRDQGAVRKEIPEAIASGAAACAFSDCDQDLS